MTILINNRLLLAFVLALTTLLTFSKVPTFDFVNLDDQAHIEQNAALKDFDLLHIWTHTHKEMTIPVLYSFLAVQAAISPTKPTFHPPNLHVKNLDPLIFHTTSLLLHTINTILVFYLLLGLRMSPWIAFVGGMFYGIHPLQTEVVSWISAQKDLLSSFWALLTILYFQKWFLLKTPPTLKNVMLLSWLSLFAILSKPTTIIVAPFLFYWWITEKPGQWKKGIAVLSLPFLFSVIFSLVTAGQQPASLLPFETNIFQRAWVSLDTITFYLQKLVWPVNLTVEYGRNPPYFLNAPDRFWTWIPAILLLFAVYKYWRRFPKDLKISFALIGLSIFPVLGLKSFAYQNVSTVSDRYVTVALVGVAWALGYALFKIQPLWQKRMAPIILAILLIFAGISFHISSHWKNIDSLWSRVIDVNPRSWFAYNNWAAHYEQKNERPKAIELYEKSLVYRPDSMVYTRVGILYYDEYQRDKARAAFQKALELDPNNAIARQNLQVF